VFPHNPVDNIIFLLITPVFEFYFRGELGNKYWRGRGWAGPVLMNTGLLVLDLTSKNINNWFLFSTLHFIKACDQFVLE
jgi:hypothetical protein